MGMVICVLLPNFKMPAQNAAPILLFFLFAFLPPFMPTKSMETRLTVWPFTYLGNLMSASCEMDRERDPIALQYSIHQQHGDIPTVPCTVPVKPCTGYFKDWITQSHHPVVHLVYGRESTLYYSTLSGLGNFSFPLCSPALTITNIQSQDISPQMHSFYLGTWIPSQSSAVYTNAEK